MRFLMKKTLHKKVVDKLKTLMKPNEKFNSKITHLTMRDSFIAAMLNPSLKSRFMQEFSRFSRLLTGLIG